MDIALTITAALALYVFGRWVWSHHARWSRYYGVAFCAWSLLLFFFAGPLGWATGIALILTDRFRLALHL